MDKMNEVKKPRKPLLYYYFVILIVILLFNALVVPYMGQSQVQDVDYGTFITMTEKHNVGKVQIEENQIIFTDKNEKNIYRTGVVNDPQLIERLYENGAKIYGEIVQEMSPLMSILLTWILPLVIFIGLG